MPIDATYIDGGRGGPEIVLNPPIADWMENTTNQPLWPAAGLAERPGHQDALWAWWTTPTWPSSAC